MRLNHSRYLDYGAKAVGDRAYERAKSTPTAKQIRFYKRLYAMCKEHNVDPRMDRYARTRMDYAMAIDALIERLKKHGVDIEGSDKNVTFVVSHGADRRGRYYTRERVVIKDAETDQEMAPLAEDGEEETPAPRGMGGHYAEAERCGDSAMSKLQEMRGIRNK
jgi:hypothetical protein